MFSTGISKLLSLKNVRPSVLPSFRHITTTKNPCVLVLTRCHVTDINHVLTPCHLIEINYVDRGVAARTPLQFLESPCFVSSNFSCFNFFPNHAMFCSTAMIQYFRVNELEEM